MNIVNKFDIRFEDDEGIYREGETLRGNICISITGTVYYRAVKLELYGVALVQWSGTDTKPANFDPYNVKKDCNREQYFRNHQTLLGNSSGDPSLMTGDHCLPFEYKLPQELPSSFEGQYGQIRYLARATMERVLKSACGDEDINKDVITKRGFTIINGLDLNFIQEAAARIHVVKHKKIGAICCLGGGSIDLEFNVPRSGYVPGEAIEVCTLVRNRSRASLLYCKAALRMIINYKSTRRRRKEMRTMVVVKQPETQPGKEKRRVSRLFIPPLPPTGISRSRLIDITYELRLSAMIEGSTDAIVFTKDIYIGSVPMSKYNMKSCISGMFNLNPPSNMNRTSSREELTPRVRLNPSAPTLATLTRCCSHTSDISACSHLPSCSSNSQMRPPAFVPASFTYDSPPHPPAAPAPATTAAAAVTECCQRQMYRRPARDFDNQSYRSIYPQISIPAEEAPPTYERGMFPAVSIRDRVDDLQSLRGEFMYLPNYPYFEAVLSNRIASSASAVLPSYTSSTNRLDEKPSEEQTGGNA